MQSIPISQLQRSASQAFAQSQGFAYVLSNNKKKGIIGDEDFLAYLEARGHLEAYEDWKLAHDPALQQRLNDIRHSPVSQQIPFEDFNTQHGL